MYPGKIGPGVPPPDDTDREPGSVSRWSVNDGGIDSYNIDSGRIWIWEIQMELMKQSPSIISTEDDRVFYSVFAS